MLKVRIDINRLEPCLAEEDDLDLRLGVTIQGSGTLPEVNAPGTPIGSKCTNTSDASPYAVSTTHYRTETIVNPSPTPSQTTKKPVKNDTYVLAGWLLRGSLSFCSFYDQERTELRAGVKFTPQSGTGNVTTIAPWQDAPYPPADVTHGVLQETSMHWYQTCPSRCQGPTTTFTSSFLGF